MIKRGKKVCSRSDFLIRRLNILKSKRSQFYLAAAIIIAMVVFSLATISNYARIESGETEVFDLRSELGLEGGRVIDFALYSGKDVSKLIENWTEVYIIGKQEQEIENWLFVYGNPNNIIVLAFTLGSAGAITVIDSGGTSTSVDVEKYKKNSTVLPASDYVNIILGNFTYRFDTAAGQNFAFLINKEGYIADSRVTGTVVSELDEKEKSKRE